MEKNKQFKERMNLYRAYRELNPDKNYWDWKQFLEVPAMLDGGNTEDYQPTSEIPTYWDEESQSFKRGMPRVIGMSGTDPIAEAYVTGKAFTKALDIIGDAYRWKSRTDAVNNYRDWLRSSEWNRSSDVSAKLMRERLKAGYREHGGDGGIVSNITNDIANAVQTGVKWGEKLLGFEAGGVVPAMQNGGENKPLQDPTIRTITFPDGSTTQTLLPWANQQGLLNTPIADVFNPVNDVYDVVQVGKDAIEGNWAGVGAGLVLAAMPKWMEKVGGAVKSGVKKLINKASRNKISIQPIPNKITMENAEVVPDASWDRAYQQAINSGDMDEVQRLRDLHFIAKAPDTKITNSDGTPMTVYHGTDENFNEFSYDRMGSTDNGSFGEGFYFTPQKNYAEMYGKNVKNVYLNLSNPRDLRGMNWIELALKRTKEGPGLYTGIGIDGVVAQPTWKNRLSPITEMVSHDNRRIKLSDAITYDDFGNVIPLSKRDNFKSPDIRYSWLPWLGVGAAAAAFDESVRQNTENKSN